MVGAVGTAGAPTTVGMVGEAGIRPGMTLGTTPGMAVVAGGRVMIGRGVPLCQAMHIAVPLVVGQPVAVAVVQVQPQVALMLRAVAAH